MNFYENIAATYFKFYKLSLFMLLPFMVVGTVSLHSQEVPYDSIAIVVENEALTRNEISLGLERLKRLSPNSTENLETIQVEYLVSKIHELLLSVEAAERNITATPSEINQEVKKYINSQKLAQNEFLEVLQKFGMNLNTLEKQLEKKIVNQKLIQFEIVANLELDEEELKALYESKYLQEKIIHYQVQHILRRIDNKKDEAKVKEDLLWIKEQIATGKTFEEIATLYSEDSSVLQNKGILPDFELSEMIPEFAQAVQELKPTEISPPIKTPYGYHLIKLLQKKVVSPEPFEKVKEELQKELYQIKYKTVLTQFIEQLKQKHQILIQDPVIERFLKSNNYDFS